MKYPDVAALDANVFVAGNREGFEATLWRKTANATSFGTPAVLGDARGQVDFSTASVAIATDGSIYYGWSSFDSGFIFVRRQLVGGTLEPAQLVGSRGAGTATDVEMAVAEDGTVFTFWREPGKPLKYRFSRDRGNTWSGVGDIGTEEIFPGINSASGPGNKVAVAYTRGLQIYVAFWNGGTFDIKRVTRNEDTYANPSVTLDNNGRAIVAWRGTDADGNSSGVFFSEQGADGSFSPLVRLFKGAMNSVSVSTDPAGNLHLFFTNTADIYYGFRPNGEGWNINNQLQRFRGNGTYHVSAATSRDTTIYSHVAFEDFSGDGLKGSVLGFRLPAPPSVRIQLEGDAPLTDETQLDVSFLDVSGTPDQLRYNWGSAPTDANPWQAFNASGLSVAVPSGLSGAVCNTLTLFVQTRNTSTGLVQALPATDSIVLDTAVQATVRLTNLAGSGSLPGFTNVPTASLTIDAPNECTDLDQVTVDEAGPTAPQSFNIDARQFSRAISLSTSEGEKELLVTLSDTLGNSAAYTRTIVYDATAPTLVTTGTIALTSTNEVNTLLRITIAGTQVNDSGSGVAGLLLTNSNAEASASAAVFVPFSALTPQSGTTTLTTSVEWSVLSGLPAAAWVPGTYTVGIQFADAAGNPTSAVVERTITLTALDIPTQHLPLVRR
ncbi:exo-alpha-sialidase [Candidatus Gracilibacteria bacterium]|nr:exo-alpha-sialidase [Candidatus Gracilibacteria bacterium]